MTSARWFSPAALLIVVLGGALGVSARALLTVPPATAEAHPLLVPAITLVVNIAGSFLLGMLLGAVGDRMPRLRAFLGTGALGGFTTYSAFAVHVVSTYSGAPVVGLLLAAVSLFGGALAAAVGLGSGERLGTRKAASEAQDGDAA